MEVTCDVSRVKPKADIYWRMGDDDIPQTGTTTSQKTQMEKHLNFSPSTKCLSVAMTTTLVCIVLSLDLESKLISGAQAARLSMFCVNPPSSVTLTCGITDGRPRDDIKRVTWMKGGQEVTSSGRNNISGRDLTINSLNNTKDDISRMDKAKMESEDLAIAVGRSVLLTCRAPTEPGNPAASWFYWHKENSDFTKNTTGFLILTPSTVGESDKFNCVAGNWIGQSDSSDWATVTVQEPPETPTQFIVLSNSTSVALTLQWQPGLNGSHPPHVFTIQYMADTKSNLFHVKTITAEDSKQQQVTIAGLELVLAEHINVSWSNARHSSRRKPSTSTVVSVVVHYQRDSGEEGRYPPEGSVDVKQQLAVVSGQFDTEATYKVWLKVYEDQLTFPSKTSHILEVTATAENKDEAHWTLGPTMTTTELGDTSKEIVCSVCADPQPSFLWTFNNKPLREGIRVRGDRIILDVVTVGDFGPFHCIATNEVEGECKTVTFQIDLVKSGPAREPSDFTILRNHTSVTLTLQWHSGYDGGYPPQTYNVQYSASNEVGRKTWSDIFSYTSDAMIWYQATVTGLQPQTQYVFSLYAENNRPRNNGPVRSLTVTQTGSTTASPQVTIASVKLEKDHMTVTWSYNGQSSRRKRSTSTNVSVVIYYQPDGGEEAYYPLQGSVAAKERQVTINGQFNDKVKYKVWLKVYEGLLDVSFQQTKPFEAAVEKEPPQPSGSTSGVVIGASVAAVGGIAIIVSLIVLFVYCHRIKNKDSNDTQAHGITVQQPAIAMNEDFRPATDDMTDQYQSLTSSADISPNQGKYVRLSKPEESANQPTQGPTYEEIGTGGLTKHSYVNASISCDDGAEYSEVKETATPQEQPTYQNITT
ncbi:hypothetical protein LSAT2_020221 [Lamellibrachia satsuma]|nr:hypothetical protein LSAT2_020221 [Lamellibrachia satsuma]